MESKTKTCKLKIAFRLRTSPTRLSPICMKRPLRSLDGRRRAYRANAHQTAQKARSGKISRWENLCQPPWEAPRPPTACALPNFPKSERWKVHINSYPCSGMYRESEIHLLVSNYVKLLKSGKSAEAAHSYKLGGVSHNSVLRSFMRPKMSTQSRISCSNASFSLKCCVQ